jgi:23S rRNA pseudouridine2605 synthase
MKTNGKSEFPIRLQVYLARSGYCSRRKAEEFIRNGSVTVNGSIITEPGYAVESEDAVYVGKTYVEPMEHVYLALNKPKGYVCSNADPHADLFARDLINVPQKASLFHVGRLDKDSTGLIFYTNDGEWANTIAHPSFSVEKEYIVHTREKLERKHLMTAVAGCRIKGELYKFERFHIRNSRSISVVLLEGKNREIRKLLDFLGYTVVSLQRIRIGDISLGKLPTGRFRFLSRKERLSLSTGQSGSAEKKHDARKPEK